MTENKAVELLEYIRETGNGEAPYVGCAQNIAINMAIKAIEENQKFHAIGTIEEFNALKEKSVAKKPVYAPTDDSCLYSEYVCPNCYIRLPNFRQKYCQCGQKLDC